MSGAEHLALSDPELANFSNFYYLSRPERYAEGVKKYVHSIKRTKELNLKDQIEKAMYQA